MVEIYIYVAIIVMSLIIEASTSALVAIWFVPSAIVGIVLALLNVPPAVQIIVFFILSGILMALFYKKLRDIISVKTEKTGIDALIGKEAVAEEDIGLHKPGRVNVDGMSWSAYIQNGGEEIKKGDIVTILEIHGVKLLCKKQTQDDKTKVYTK